MHARLFPDISTFAPTDFQTHGDNVVFGDPNKRDIVYLMHINLSASIPSTLRYTSMFRRRHLQTHVNLGRQNRFLKRQDNAVLIRQSQIRLSTTNSFSISPAKYDDSRGVAAQTLSPPYSIKMFRNLRRRHDIGRQRDEAKLARMIRVKFGENSLIVLGNGSSKVAVLNHPSTLGVGLGLILKRLRFNVVLLDEFRTSKMCPLCRTGELKNFCNRPSPRPWLRHRKSKFTVSSDAQVTHVVIHSVVWIGISTGMSLLS
jgi:hypothetical protein